MTDYDSDDSSLGEFTETTTLLGYVSREPAAEDSVSRLGGKPEWLDPETPPSAALARCGACGDMMTLLLQLNGELPERFPGHERFLYVFSCRKARCRRREGSVRAVRATRVSREVAEAAREAERREEEAERARREADEAERKKQAGLGSALFGNAPLSAQGGAAAAAAAVNPFASPGAGSSNPFSSGGTASAANPFAAKPAGAAPAATVEIKAGGAVKANVAELPKSFAETLTLNVQPPPAEDEKKPEPQAAAAHEAWPEDSALPRAYPALYLVDVDYETLDPLPTALPANVKVEEAGLEDEGGAAGGAGSSGNDVFESTMDADFQKFADRMEQNPEQVIRYEFAGEPVLYSKKGPVAKVVEGGELPRCGGCGGARVFEMQLTPHAITELEEEEETGLEGMEWGTIIVGVCKEDCQAAGVGDGKVGYLEEWVGVQWEELVK